jgi:hypothetical protein
VQVIVAVCHLESSSLNRLRNLAMQRNQYHACFNATVLATLILVISGGQRVASAADGPVRVYILAGQSNMEGKAKISLLERQIRAPGTSKLFAHLHDNGVWKTRDDVHIRFLGRSGPLTVGYGSPDRIGPELQFGHVMGDHFPEPVLLIKTAWGGKSLYRDFRPPSAGMPDDFVLDRDLARAQKRRPNTTLEEVRTSYGFYYREMVKQVRDTLMNLDTYVPDAADRGYTLAGFVWFQGWNDMVNADYTAAYTDNLACLIRDIRRDLDAADLPCVIGQLGVGGVTQPDSKPNPKRDAFKAAQAAAAEKPEFRGTVALVRTDRYWDKEADAVFQQGWKDHLQEWERVGSDYPFHYLGSAKTYCAIGGAFAEALLQLDVPPESTPAH